MFDSHHLFLAPPMLWLWSILLLLLWSALCIRLTLRRERRLKAWHEASMQNKWQLQEAIYLQEEKYLGESLSQTRAELDRARAELQVRGERIQALEVKLAECRVLASEQQRTSHSEAQLLQTTRDSLTREFELLANRLFDAKQTHFNRDSKATIEQVISPFQKQLQDFYQRLEEGHRADSAQRNQLVGQIFELQKQATQISAEAVNLTNALKGDNKLQGTWGEVVLARLLEQSGLQKGREYQLQVSSTNAEGRRFQPDVVVHLPDQRDVVIDAKVSLVAYEQYCSCGSGLDRERALKAHLDSVKNHIKNLSEKNYAHLEQVESLDFVLLFVPIEGAYSLVSQHRDELLQDAYRNGVVLVGPSSLMVALRTIEALWHRDKQDRNVAEIVAGAGKLYDQFVLFVNAMDELGVGLKKAESAYQVAYRRLSKGRGNLIRRVDNLKQLGAKSTRSLDEHLVEGSQVNDNESEASDTLEGGISTHDENQALER